MGRDDLRPTPILATLGLMWKTARRRADARAVRQAKLFQQRTRNSGDLPSRLLRLIQILFSLGVHSILAILVAKSMEQAAIVTAEREGKIVLPKKGSMLALERAAAQLAQLERFRKSQKWIDHKKEQQHLSKEEAQELAIGMDELSAAWRKTCGKRSDRYCFQRLFDLRQAATSKATNALAKEASQGEIDDSQVVEKLDLLEQQIEQEVQDLFGEIGQNWRRHDHNPRAPSHVDETAEQTTARLRRQWAVHGVSGFIGKNPICKERDLPTIKTPDRWSPLMIATGTFMLLWWLVMIVCQGEGLELDVQRRRHPIWEWLLSHPVHPAAAFAGEMLAPLTANPIYLLVPAFWVMLFNFIYPSWAALLAGLVIGPAFAFAAAALNKMLEVTAMLRLPVRSRGAALGIMSWLGYAGMMLPILFMGLPLRTLARGIAPIADFMPSLPLRILTVGWSGQAPSLWQVVVSGWLVAGCMLVGAVGLAAYGVARGLESGGAAMPVTSVAPRAGWLKGNGALYRKELLWFRRDRGALVQAVLIPLTLSAFQLFYFRDFLRDGDAAWSTYAGLAVICGAYFLLTLGPRSLASEGAALWIAHTWPHGIEGLLKAKARLCWWLANIVVGLALLAVLAFFPADWWKLLAVAVAWVVFARSLAQKAVTLVTAPVSSGEGAPQSRGRNFAATIGTFTFAAGVFTQTWHVMLIGLVYSLLTATAMWQNLRARLPYLFDPWSETLPPAPTLMHAMIAIAVMVEGVGCFSAVAFGVGGIGVLGIARTLAYGSAGVITWVVMHNFLKKRDVYAVDVWCWPSGGGRPAWLDCANKGWGSKTWFVTASAAMCGAVLGGAAVAYTTLLAWLPLTAPLMRETAEQAAAYPIPLIWSAMLAVIMAPFAEEYLFRGLLFRALDREWGGWRALMGSAVFFAIYHPPLAWLPVAGVGLLNSLIFKKTGLLAPCVLVHMAYNAVVVFAST